MLYKWKKNNLVFIWAQFTYVNINVYKPTVQIFVIYGSVLWLFSHFIFSLSNYILTQYGKD